MGVRGDWCVRKADGNIRGTTGGWGDGGVNNTKTKRGGDRVQRRKKKRENSKRKRREKVDERDRMQGDRVGLAGTGLTQDQAQGEKEASNTPKFALVSGSCAPHIPHTMMLVFRPNAMGIF